MIGLDTNVVIRFLADDDPVQSPIAARQFARLTADRPGFVSLVVLAEIAWVLSRAYKITRKELGETIEQLLQSAELVIESSEIVWIALGRYQRAQDADFPDILIAEIARSNGATKTVTFDKMAAKRAGMTLLQ